MSVIKVNSVQLGQSATVDNNITVAVPVTPDGSFKISKGIPGDTSVDLMTIDSSGNVAFAGEILGVDIDPILKPVNQYPAQGETNVGSDSTIGFSSLFYSLYGKAQKSLQIQVSTSSTFATLTYDSTVATTDPFLVVDTGTLNVQVSTVYYWRIRFQDTDNVWSAWSDATSFTTASLFYNAKVIGVPGTLGFGVGVYDDENSSVKLSTLGLSPMTGFDNPASDNYGNYQHTNSSIMVFVPAFYYRVGNAAHPKFATFGANSLEIVGTDTYATEAAANAAGFVLHRAFIDGGVAKSGFFVDKYLMSQKAGQTSVGVSVRYGAPISLTTSTSYTYRSSTMPNCTGILADAIELCRARGTGYQQTSAFIYSALAMLSLAHGQYATSTTACAWFDATYTTNFPKGCNNGSLGDVNDATLTFVTAGDAGTSAKPQTGSANVLAKTTHNGQNNGVVDLNGAMFEPGIGITNYGASATATTQITNANLYVLKESVAIGTLTSGWNGANDVWQSSGNIGTKYDTFASSMSLGTPAAVYWGNGNNPAFFSNTNGSNRAVCGILGVNDSTFNGTGTNLFGNDYFYKYNIENMFVIFGGNWSFASYAGVFSRFLASYRSGDYDFAGARACCYAS